MNITLDVVRATLRRALGRDSFVASFIQTTTEAQDCPTACITADGRLRYNPAFVNQYVSTEQDLFCLVMHELMHPMFGHFVYSAGELENIAADMVINAAISLVFAHASGDGSLFTKVYKGTGIEGLLRPHSAMRESRYNRLYSAFYSGGHGLEKKLSTGEVIQTLKVLTPDMEVCHILLLGTHGPAGKKEGALPADVLSKIAEDIQRAIASRNGQQAGYGETLYELLMETLKSHLSIKKVLLQKYTTKRKLDQFKQLLHRPRITVSPIPLHPSKRDLVLLAAGIMPFHFHNHGHGVTTKDQGLAVYLDVSGSVNDHLPQIIGVLSSLKRDLKTIFLFSNKVIEVPFHTLLEGKLHTTYGTDFNCIAEHILDHSFDKAVVFTDGHATLEPEFQDELKRRRIRIMTTLFAGKDECPEFAPLGDVLQLNNIAH